MTSAKKKSKEHGRKYEILSFFWVSLVPPSNFEILPHLDKNRFRRNKFQFNKHQSSYRSTPYNCVTWGVVKRSKKEEESVRKINMF